MVVGDVATAVDVLVLGAGPAGYVGAIRAAQLGRRVTLVDQGPPGGICLHRGCIPLKALLAASERYQQARVGLDEMGISAGPVSFDWERVATWKQGVVDKLSEGVARLLAGNKVEIVSGRGWFINGKEMRVEGEYGSHRFIFERCLLATGAKPRVLPALPLDGADHPFARAGAGAACVSGHAEHLWQRLYCPGACYALCPVGNAV